MTIGRVGANRQTVASITIRTPHSAEFNVDVVVDTGFDGTLAISSDDVTALGLKRFTSIRGTLADGSTLTLPLYKVELLWLGRWRLVYATTLGNERLLGMGILDGHRLTLHVTLGGAVEIIPLP